MISKLNQLVTSWLAIAYKAISSLQSSQDLRCVASAYASSLDQRLQELELRKIEVDIAAQEQRVRLQQLQNEKLELDLMEQRIRIQELQQSN
jgi:hypothetical protein